MPNSSVSFIQFLASDGYQFKVPLNHALISPTIRTMLQSIDQNILHSGSVCIRFREISSPVLSAVIDYLQYRMEYTQASEQIPPFLIDPQLGLQLLVAADFLQC